MVLTKQNNTDLTPEQKLGLNLTKDLFTVLTSDTEKVASLKGDIILINEVLNKGNEEEITYCNKNMTSKYYKEQTFPLHRFKLISFTQFQNTTYFEKYFALREIGVALADMVSQEKLKQLGKEVAKTGTEYVIDKIKEKNQRHNSQ